MYHDALEIAGTMMLDFEAKDDSRLRVLPQLHLIVAHTELLHLSLHWTRPRSSYFAF